MDSGKSALPTEVLKYGKVGWSRRNRIPKAGAFGKRLRRCKCAASALQKAVLRHKTQTPAKLHESSGFRDLIPSALPTEVVKYGKVGWSRRNRIPKAGAFGKRLRRCKCAASA